jgi:L-fuculose-phosphate aldolase
MMAEPVVSLGPEIPMVRYSRPGSASLSTDIGEALQCADVLVLERHGVLAVGGSFEQAYLRMELVEHLAKIALNARLIGEVRCLPASEIEALAKRGRPASSPVREASVAVSSASGDQDGPRRTDTTSDVSGLVSSALKRFS